MELGRENHKISCCKSMLWVGSKPMHLFYSFLCVCVYYADIGLFLLYIEYWFFIDTGREYFAMSLVIIFHLGDKDVVWKGRRCCCSVCSDLWRCIAKISPDLPTWCDLMHTNRVAKQGGGSLHFFISLSPFHSLYPPMMIPSAKICKLFKP